MKQLIQAIYDHFDSNVVGHTSLYNTLADDDAVFPYVVMSIIPGAPDDTFSEQSETGIVQFTIYSDSPSSEEALDIRTSIQTAFDYKPNYPDLVMADYILIWFAREPGTITKMEVKGNQVWQVTIQYSFIIQKK